MRLIGTEGENKKTQNIIMFSGILLSGTILGLSLLTDIGTSNKLQSMCVDVKGSLLAEISVYVTSIITLLFFLNDRITLDVNMDMVAKNKGMAVVSIILLILLLTGLNLIVLSFIKNKQNYLDIGVGMVIGGVSVYSLSRLYGWYLSRGENKELTK